MRRPRDGLETAETGVAVLDSIDDEHVFGGIVDLRLADHVVLETRLTPLGIRKLLGAKFVPR